MDINNVIVKMMHDYKKKNKLSYRELGDRLGMSGVRVSQLINKVKIGERGMSVILVQKILKGIDSSFTDLDKRI
jgi:hypothetical protein